jgi:hypothetical protein
MTSASVPAPGHPVESGRRSRDYTELVEQLFCRGEAISPFPGFDRVAPVEILVDGILVRARLERNSAQYDVTIFDGVEGFAGELWERSAKTLLRLRALGHPAIPVIEVSKQRPGEGIAFTITRSKGGPLDLDEAVRWAAARPLEAFEQFSLLLDALKRLHGARVMHRLLLPTSFRYEETPAGPRLSLSRFEMSALISNIIRRVVSGDATEIRAVTRQLYLSPAGGHGLDTTAGVRHLAYLAPEIHPYLFDENHRSRRDWENTDVFGLGVFGWELFCGGIPFQLPDELEAVARAAPDQRVRALSELHAAMRRTLHRSAQVPPEFRDVLDRMLAAEPERRDSSYDLAQMIERSWDAIRGEWEEKVTAPYLIAFMPDESADTLYKERGWISRSPRDAAGREELRAFYEEELQDAYLVHSTTGAEGYATGPTDALREAEWVLIGKRAVWFCAYLRDRGIDGTTREICKDALVVKYLREHIYARELYTAQPRRKVPAIDMIAFFPQQSIGDKRVGRPSWELLNSSVDRSNLRDPENEKFLQSLDFLLDYQRAVLDARTYPYVALDRGGAEVELKLDEGRDAAWRQRERWPLLTAYATDPRRRPPLGDFLASLDDGSGWTELSLDGRLESPGFTGRSDTVQLLERRDENTIVVRVTPGTNLPARGWLRPAEDSGSQPQLGRQLRARVALERQPMLISELRHPRPMEIGRHDWDVDPEGKLEGNSPEVILAMLSRLPFYALQGPPGSGKTTAVAHALKLFLADEHGSKVLVSAQSNYALDNLAERLVKLLPKDLIVLRETSQRGKDTVSEAIQPYTIDKLSRRTHDNVKHTLKTRLERHARGDADHELGRPLTETERQISQEWLESVDSGQFELSDRLRSGASVVLATCSVAADALADATDITESFDWVIVEEAAKAWPTELIVPLSMGTRWTLIGDHRQLGAHRSDEVEKFLDSLRHHPTDKIKVHYQAKRERLDALNLFRSLFEPDAEQTTVSALPASLSDRSLGLGQLKMQFRMHSDIAEPVRRVFYRSQPVVEETPGLWESFLESHPSASRPHGVTVPPYLRDRPLVWIDTEDYPGCHDEPMWFNNGEVTLIDRLVGQLQPESSAPGEDDDGSLAVLTPYKEQVDRLQRRGNLTGRVFSVHSFQGREADRVVVSLVRTARVGDESRQNVGHVGKAEVANVLLSRAKRLLVLVGRFEHFRDNGGEVWRDVTSLVERFGTRVTSDVWSA